MAGDGRAGHRGDAWSPARRGSWVLLQSFGDATAQTRVLHFSFSPLSWLHLDWSLCQGLQKQTPPLVDLALHKVPHAGRCSLYCPDSVHLALGMNSWVCQLHTS